MTDRRRRRWALGARVAVRKLTARAREMMFTEPTTSDGRAAERAGARTLAAEAGRLRGGVAKVAQMTAYFHGPGAATSEGARAALAGSWDQLPPMEPALARRVVEAELGEPIDELFARWDDRPLASASLGQVHSAMDHEGNDLAVKVQYPEIAEALRSDLSSERLVRDLAGTGSTVEATAVEAIKLAVLAELDYRAEAASLEGFADRFADDHAIVIPRPLPSLSSARVLSMQRLRGAPIAGHHGDDVDLREVAAAVFRFAWRSALEHGVINADPNPGNYLVLGGDPARVGFVDFGCTATLAPDVVAGERALWKAVLHHDRFTAADRFRSNLVDRGLVTSARVLHGETFRAWERLVCQPFLTGDDVRWGPGEAAALADATGRLLAAGELRLPGDLALLWRQRLGVAAVLGGLSAAVPFRRLLTAIIGAR